MRRQEHMKRQNVDVVIGDDKSFCFDGFDDAASSLDSPNSKKWCYFKAYRTCVPTSSTCVKNSSPLRGKNNQKKKDLQENLKLVQKTGAHARIGRHPLLVSMLNSALETSVLSLCARFSTCVDAFLKRFGKRQPHELVRHWIRTATRNILSAYGRCRHLRLA